MIKNKLGLLSLIAGLFLSFSAQAALVTLSFTGTTDTGTGMEAVFSVNSADITPTTASGDLINVIDGSNFPLNGARFNSGGNSTVFDTANAYYGPDINFETFEFRAGDSSSALQLGFVYGATFLYDPNTNNVTLTASVRDPVTFGFVEHIYTGSNFSINLLDLDPNGLNGFTNTENFTVDTLNISVTGVSAVPVPAAAWLFGSGLIGLFGFARKKSS